MITNLHVKNLALIDEADVSFRPGLNILTGETGAGKSILLGSIDLALGQKMTGDLIRSGADHALVEMVFEIENAEVLRKLEEMGVSAEDGLLILSRRVQEGRSICRLNGETCTASRLREISALLLDIHGQHEHQSLLYPDRQLEILDAYGRDRLQELLDTVEAAWDRWRKAVAEQEKYDIDESRRQRELSLLEYEIREIGDAQLTEGEDETLEEEHRRMANAQRIAEVLQTVHRLTGDGGAGEEVGRAVREMRGASELDPELRTMADSLEDIDGLLADLNRDIAAYQDAFTFSEEELFRTEKRLDVLNGLKMKYGKTIADVLRYRDAQKEKHEQLLQFAERKQAAAEAAEAAERELEEASCALSRERQTIARELSERIEENLQDLNFLTVDFAVSFRRSEIYRRNGCDEIAFEISTNTGEPRRPLAKVASGGELSRIMLAIKALLADRDSTETLLFDEIDSGVSGRTAQKVAEKMERISRSHQVLCVTHLAQLAAMADHHFGIVKVVENGMTQTRIHELTAEERVEEIARILGGARITDAVRAGAREMRELAELKKKSLQ